MSHWYRAPRAISVKDLLARAKKSIIIDQSVPMDLLAELPERAQAFADLRLNDSVSLLEVVHLCQRSRGILLTAEAAYVPLLREETRIPWGLILVPEVRAAKVEALRRLATENLVLRPSVERHVIVELFRHNCVLVDLRSATPVVSVLCHSRWLGRSG